MSEIKKNKVGRPAVNATPVTVRLPPDLLALLDASIVDNETRPEAIRRILKERLTKS